MDRLRRVLAGGMLAMLLGTIVAASGCRSMRNEVPPGPKYPTTGGADPASSAGFNSAPHQYNGMGGMYGNTPGQSPMSGSGIGGGASGAASGSPTDGLPIMGSGGSALGTPMPGGPNMAQPTPNVYGGPGTNMGSYGTGR